MRPLSWALDRSRTVEKPWHWGLDCQLSLWPLWDRRKLETFNTAPSIRPFRKLLLDMALLSFPCWRHEVRCESKRRLCNWLDLAPYVISMYVCLHVEHVYSHTCSHPIHAQIQMFPSSPAHHWSGHVLFWFSSSIKTCKQNLSPVERLQLRV